MNKAASSVKDLASAMNAGNQSIMKAAMICAQPVMMKLILKPTPVRVTTPITMPTVAAAAPTASAYLAPVSKASSSTALSMRPIMPSHFCPAQTRAIPTAKKPSLMVSPSLPQSTKAISASSTCSTTSKTQLALRLPRTEVLRPTIMQDVMPVNAAR